VDGTREITRFAATGQRKPIHFISTTWVINPEPGVFTYDETWVGNWQGMENGYSQSKWVAEAVVRKAQDAGIDTTIHRMDFVMGNEASGSIGTDEFMVRMMQASIAEATLPSEPMRIDLIAADYVGRAVVTLAKSTDSYGKCFQHQAAHEYTLEEMAAAITNEGYPLERVPYDQWRERVSATSSSPMFPLKYFLRLYRSDMFEGIFHMLVTAPATNAALDRLKPDLRDSHPSGDGLIRAMIHFLQRKGRLPMPNETLEASA